MKKHVFLFLFLLVFSFSESFSQAFDRSGLGIRAGVNLSNFRGDAQAVTLNVGPTAGLYYRIGISDIFTVQPELMYSMQGSRFDGTQNQINDRLSYLNLPVVAQVWLAPGFNIHAGPYVGVLADVWSEGRGDLDVAADYRGWDWGATAGLEYETPIGLNFAIRYNFGFADIVGGAGLNGGQGGNIYNRFAQVLVGWTF